MSDDARDWTQRLFAAIDRRDAEGFAEFIDEDAVFRFGNLPPVAGRGAIRETVAGFFASVRALAHGVHDLWRVNGALICRGEVTYTRLDGSTLTVPFANVLALKGERVSDYAIYVDAARLYAP